MANAPLSLFATLERPEMNETGKGKEAYIKLYRALHVGEYNDIDKIK